MSTKHFICCDSPSCDKQIEYKPYQRIEEQLPEEWIRVVPANRGVEPLVFCCWDHLHWYGHRQIVLEDEES